MWTSTWALNTFVCCGKTEDWMVHMIGQAIGGVTNATHGMTLSAVSISYYKFVLNFEQDKFARFAHNVFEIPYQKDVKKTALLGLEALEDWMREIGVVMNLTDLGVKEDMIDDILKGTKIFKNVGYHDFTKEEIKDIILKSM